MFFSLTLIEKIILFGETLPTITLREKYGGYGGYGGYACARGVSKALPFSRRWVQWVSYSHRRFQPSKSQFFGLVPTL